MNCSYCGHELPDESMLACPACQSPTVASSTVSPSLSRSIIKPEALGKLPVRVEIAFADDITGSSGPYKERGILEAARCVLDEAGKRAAEIVCWLQAHGDSEYGQNPTLIVDRGTASDVLAALASLDYGGGGDAEETHTEAIYQLLKTIPFTADPARARGAIIAFLTDETKDTGCPLTPQELGAQVRQRGLLLYLIATATPKLQAMVNAAGGILLPISNDPDEAELRRLGAMVGKSLTMSVVTGSKTATMPI
jgi:hypothetical protein